MEYHMGKSKVLYPLKHFWEQNHENLKKDHLKCSLKFKLI